MVVSKKLKIAKRLFGESVGAREQANPAEKTRGMSEAIGRAVIKRLPNGIKLQRQAIREP